MDNNLQPGDIEIEMEDVGLIMGEDFDELDILLNSTFCSACKQHVTTIVDYNIYMNKIDDIIFKGKCKACGSPVVKYIETGESKSMGEIARHIRMLKNDFF